MWLSKAKSRMMRIFKDSKSVDAECSPAVKSLRMVLERVDARRARASKGSRVRLVRFKKRKEVGKKTVERGDVGESGCEGEQEGLLAIGSDGFEEESEVGNVEVMESGCDGEQDGLLAIGLDVFEEENLVGNVVEVEEGIKMVAGGSDSDLDELMHIGPEVFEGDQFKNMGLGYDRLDANVPVGVTTSITSKGKSVQHWVDNMKAMWQHESKPGWMAAIGDDHRYPHYYSLASMAESSAHYRATGYDGLSVIEELEEIDTSEDDDETIVTAFEVPIENDENSNLETPFCCDFSDQGRNEDLPALLDTLDEPGLPAIGLEEHVPIPTFTINKTASQSPNVGGKLDPVTAMMTDLAQRKARCTPVTPPHRHLGTQVWSGDSPTLLEVQDNSDSLDTMPEADESCAALEINQQGDSPNAVSKANDSVEAMKAPITGNKAAFEAPISSRRVESALRNLIDEKIEGKTIRRSNKIEDLSQKIVGNGRKAEKERDEVEGEIASSQARKEDPVAWAKEKLASMFYVSAGQSQTKELKVGRMVATQTKNYGQALSATSEDSKALTLGLKASSKVEKTVQSTPISLETTHEAWLVFHKPDRNAWKTALQPIADGVIADIEIGAAARRAAFRSKIEQEMEKFRSAKLT